MVDDDGASFLRGYREEAEISNEWLSKLPLFLRLREIIVYAGMHRSYDMTKLDDWTRDYLAFSRARI
jgi:amicoumacin kinase